MNSDDEFKRDPPPPYQLESDTNKPLKSDQLNDSNCEKLQEIILRHEISDDFAGRLQQLQGFKIVFIFDDSGSMSTTLQDSPLNNTGSFHKATRWDELQYFSSIAVEIAALFDPQGCTVYFLNR